MDEIFAEQDWDYWKAKFDALGITYGQAAKCEDLAGDEQLRHAGAVVKAAPGFGAEWAVGTPVFVYDEDKKTPEAPPGLGEHNEAICADLGYSSDQIAAFKEAGVLK